MGLTFSNAVNLYSWYNKSNTKPRRCSNSPRHDTRMEVLMHPNDSIPCVCLQCGSAIHKKRRGTAYCSHACAQEAKNAAHRERNAVPQGICQADRGTYGELLVCCDLLHKGYDVYRSVSPAAKCDLVVIRPPVMYRVEVRTGHLKPHSITMAYSKDRLTAEFTDVVAVVIQAKEIWYFTYDEQPITL